MNMDKTVYTTIKSVETVSVLPRTLIITPERMPIKDANATMFVIYGLDAAQRKVWCATFIDEQEAEAWVYGSKILGRPILGAVMAGQENKLATAEAQKGEEMSDDAVAVGNEDSGPAGKPS